GPAPMARPHKRACVWNESRQRWVSPRTGKEYTDAEYQRLCESGKKAAAASKALAEVVRSEDYQQQVAEMIERQKSRAGRMLKLPGMSDFDHQLSNVRWTRRGPVDLKITRGGSGNGNDGSR